MITSDTSTWPAGDQVWAVARAIAQAEGANVSGSAPDRYNNPGDLTRGDEHGQAVSGYAPMPSGITLIVFSSKEAGWNALYTKLANILAGTSTAYSAQMTWRQIAQSYAPNQPAWLNNVTRILAVDPESTFASFFLPRQEQSTQAAAR